MESLSGRYRIMVRRLMELSGERRVGPMGLIYGQTVGLGSRTLRFLTWLVVSVCAVAGVAWVLFGGEDCNGVVLASELAGTGEHFTARAQTFTGCDMDAVRRIIAKDYLFAAVYTSAFALFLTVWWNASWDTEPGYSRLRGNWFAGLALATFVTEVLENTVTLIGLESQDDVLGLRFAGFIFTVAAVKWLLVVVLGAATVAVVLVWLIRAAAVVYRRLRRSDDANQTPTIIQWHPDPNQPNLGICLSGGGIRSAAFGLGALSALEETAIESPRPGQPPGVLGQADLLASVSGGGYAASAWRLAVGTADRPIIDRPIIGDPNCHLPGPPTVPGLLGAATDETAGHLFPRLRDLREYARNGRGGLLASLVLVAVQMAWHLFLTLALVAILAWPLGRFVGSWIITTPADAASGRSGIEYSRLAVPVLGLLAILAVLLVVRSFTNRGPARKLADRASLAVLTVAAMLFASLVLLPWLVDFALPALPGSTTSNSVLAAVLAAGVVASVLRMVQAPIESMARSLGGVMLAIGLGWFGLAVAAQSAAGRGLFALDWRTWLLAVLGYTGIMMLTNPDLWSLHWLYRRRLSESFANRWNPEVGAWETLPPAEQPPLSAYAGAPGPKQVICTVAARGDVTNTGIPVLSMTFEPDHVTIHCGPDPANPRGSLSHAIATTDYEQLFDGRAFAGRYRSVFCAAALSAAALAPSLGRHSLGTTNTLIAALNLRLGVWMPNPMFRRGRRAGPDLFNMFKELSGRFDLADPNVYVTDGGHWENLALVELVRRRTRRIIAVDASGDKGYSFTALHEAIELARLECATTITFVDDGLEAMKPAGRARAAKNWCQAEIHYPDGGYGRLLYVKAQASEQMPLDILRYSKEDPTFPNYSTVDQLLKEAAFSNLAVLGRESMIAALDDHHRWLFEPFGDEAENAADADASARRAALPVWRPMSMPMARQTSSPCPRWPPRPLNLRIGWPIRFSR